MHGFHHLRDRMRDGEGLEPYPARTKLIRILDYVMYGVGILAPVALVPQIIEIYKGNASGVSMLTWILLSCVNLLWATYGIVHRDKHILLANGFFLLFHIVIITGLLLY